VFGVLRDEDAPDGTSAFEGASRETDIAHPAPAVPTTPKNTSASVACGGASPFAPLEHQRGVARNVDVREGVGARGNTTVLGAEPDLTAAWMATVSSVTPSPTAPKSRTETMFISAAVATLVGSHAYTTSPTGRPWRAEAPCTGHLGALRSSCPGCGISVSRVHAPAVNTAAPKRAPASHYFLYRAYGGVT